MCLKGSGCLFPCTACTVGRDSSCTEAGTNAPPRDVHETVRAQLRNVLMGDFRGAGAMRTEAETAHSLNSIVPALAAWAGLGNGPRMLYRLPGFDRLHVCFSCCMSVLPVSSCLWMLRTTTAFCGGQAACVGTGCQLPNVTLRVYTHSFWYCAVVCVSSGHGRWYQPQGRKRGIRVPPEDSYAGWPCTARHSHQLRARHQHAVQACLTPCTSAAHTPRVRQSIDKKGFLYWVTSSERAVTATRG